MMTLQTRILPLIFLASMASLAFEVLLTRIFSITLWYHFAFMVISIAMLGFAAYLLAFLIIRSLVSARRTQP